MGFITVLALHLEMDSWFQGIEVFVRGRNILMAMNNYKNFG